MRKTFLLWMAALLLACMGCADGAAQSAVQLPGTVEATPMEVEVSIKFEDTPAPTGIPTPSPTPEPVGVKGAVIADSVGIVYTSLARGSTVEITGETDGYYTALLDGVKAMVEIRFIRLESAAAYQTWTGYAKSNTPVYASPYLDGEPEIKLKQNTKVTVLDDLDGALLIEWDGTRGYVMPDQIKSKKITGGGGGGGNTGGSDGGDIQLSWRTGPGSGIVRLGTRHEGEAAFVPQKGTVLADQTEVYLGFVSRGDEVTVIGEDETCYEVLVDGVTGKIYKPLVRLEGEEPYQEWDGYAESNAPFYSDYRLCGKAEELKRNAEVHILADLGDRYLAEVDGKVGYMPKTEVSEDKVKQPTGGGGGGGSEWTEPVL